MTDDMGPKPSRCPTCGKPAGRDTAPFCSKRCRMVDLGRWFGERYVVSSPLPGVAETADDGDDAER
jgi:endogenous inhibitor of DNA gyrase (YacG/DUF329 family)